MTEGRAAGAKDADRACAHDLPPLSRAYLGIGSNIDPERHVRQALRLLTRAVHVTALSMFYRTQPEGRPEQPEFYNGVAEVSTGIPPRELKLSVLRGIEAALGRTRSADRFAARTIDLDLLLYDSLVISEDDLRLPDPDILRRPFLAFPLEELAPDLRVPGSALTLGEIAGRLCRGGLQPLPEYTRRLRREIRCEP